MNRTHKAFSAATAAVLLNAGLSGCSFAVGDQDRQGTGPSPTAVVASSAPARQVLQVDKTVWYGGLKLTFGEVAYDPDPEADTRLTAKVLIENLSGNDYRPNLPILFSTGDQQYDGTLTQNTLVGGRQQSRFDLEFRVDDLAGLAGSSFIIGRGDEAQTTVPLGDGELVANEPRNILATVPKLKVGDLSMRIDTCDLRADMVPNHNQAKRDHLVLACFIDAQAPGATVAGHYFGEANLRLKLPDGTVVGPTESPNEVLTSAIEPDTYAAFMIQWPAPGNYALQVVDAHNDGKKSVKEIKLTL